MGICTSPVLESTNFFCRIPSPTTNSPFSSFRKNNPLRKSPSDSIYLLRNRSWTPLAASRRGIAPVSARFRRPLRRRNTLREKIVPSNGDQVRGAPELFNPDFKVEEKVGPSLDLGTEKDIVENDRLGNGNSSKESVLWDKLDDWVNQYKDDSEYWGIGTGPIFIVYKNSDANVTRVVVNEEEIVKRSQIRAWSFESKEVGEEFASVNSKISRAKVIAKDIESGKYMLPKSSSIFRYVVEGKNSSFAEELVVSIAKKGESILKITPQVGFALLCGCCVFWVMKKLIAGNDKVELSREEVEMLRRKKMSRMKREELEKGSAKVLDDVPELAVPSLRRPELDRSELMKSIKQTELLRENLIPSHSNASFQNDDKIKEIREMVKKVHELERENQHQNDNQVEALKEASDDISMSQITSHEGRIEKNMKSSVDIINNKGVLEEESLNNGSIIPEGELSNAFCDERAIIDTKVEDQKTDEEIDTKEKANSGFDVEHTADYKDVGTSSFIVRTNEGQFGKNEIKTSKSKNRKSKSSSGTCSKKSVKIKPRIISSVKEAREYLATKRRTKLNKSQISDELVQSADMIGSTTNVLGAKKTMLGSDSEAAFLPKKPSSDYTAEAKLREGSCFNDLSTANDSSQVERKNCADFLNDTADGKPTNSFLTEENSTSTSWDPQSMSNSSPTKTLNGKHSSSIHNVTSNESSSVSSSQDLDNLIVERQSDQEKQEESLQNPVDCRELEINGNKSDRTDQAVCIGNEVGPSSEFDKALDSSSSSADSSRVCNMEKKGYNNQPDEVDVSAETGKSDSVSTVINGPPDKHEVKGPNVKTGKSLISEESWIEKNFQEFDPIVQKMRVGFKENYVLAKDKAQEELPLSAVVNKMGSALESEELEWMDDESLREIVFQVRENELAGRDPFHMMDASDKHAFFEGLERKVEKVNEKLLPLHEYYHSRIENLDYGADGISLDDPPEKVIPYWKGPTFDKDPEFLSKKLKQKDTEGSLSKVEGLAKSSIPSPNASVDNSLKKSVGESSNKSKTLIESSDGSTRPGTKGGKEHWEHTKKWSQGFLEVYNAETDPEVKSIMRNMGKDLDRWITEKEIQDATDLLTKIPKRKRRYIEKKMNKLKREVKKYGAQAVVSKYKEYSDEKEEDYLWWLDLPFVLCIELYTVEEDVPKVGFYSVEMAADLELDPKQYHVIAFEDPGDSKNFCYIVQAHMDMLASGKAFVVARPPKDAFREAKATGFSVTVIRKGEIALNVDQTLEEVEEQITEIGSKIYHDKIMHERSVDAHTLLKGVITADRSTKGRSRAGLTKSTKS